MIILNYLPPFCRNLRPVLSLGAALAAAILPVQLCAAKPLVSVVAYGPGKTPFINLVRLKMEDPALLAYITFTIAPKPGSVTRPVSARYPSSYLTQRGFLDTANGAITVPVFGLYQRFANSVKIVAAFVDGTSQEIDLELTSPHYVSGIYDHPAVVVQPRTTDTTLSYDFMELKSFINPHSPTIVDTDGEIRWVGTSDTASMEAIFLDNSFFVTAITGAGTGEGGTGTTILRNEFDGSTSVVADYAAAGVTTFHHNFDFGKTGILTGITTADYLESTIMEVATTGQILHIWNMAKIISDAMTAGGDDPSLFVAKPGALTDWFHNNANAYRPSDNSLIVSSRENFVIALDYETGAIKWIMGDPTKQWHQFASLRKYALKATDGTHPPIGQHAVSVYRDKLLLFDDGYYSADHTPKGRNRTYSAPRKYSLDLNNRTYTEVWDYLANPSIDSPITSSVYEDKKDNYLVDYAVEGPYLFAELLGLNPAGQKVFDYKYTEVDMAATAWNAVPVHLENLVFDYTP
jgi:arylsulfate sulfotransferase